MARNRFLKRILPTGASQQSMPEIYILVEIVHLASHFFTLTNTSTINVITSISEDFNICNIQKYRLCCSYNPSFVGEVLPVRDSAIWVLRPQDLILQCISMMYFLNFFDFIKYPLFPIYTSSEIFSYSNIEILS